MPSQKHRSMEDTWTTDELKRARNSQTGERRHHRDRDEDRKRDRVISDDKRKERRHDDDDRRRRHRRDEEEEADVQLSEGERERLRRERRAMKEKDGKAKKGEIQFRRKADDREGDIDDIEAEDTSSRRRHHGDREERHRNGEDGDRRRKHHDDEDREKRRRHHDDDNDDRRRKQRDEDSDKKRRNRDEDDDRRRKHRDDDDEDERERRRRERRKEKDREDDDERRRRHEEKRREEKDREKRKDRDERKEGERSDKKRDRKDRDKESEKDREKRKEREREERRREREEQKRREKEEEEKKKREEEEEAGGDDYEEDFEDYEEDFEEDDDDDEETPAVKGSIHKETRRGTKLDYSDSEVNDVLRALDAENDRLLNSSRSPQPTAGDYGSRRNGRDDDDSDDDKYDRAYQPRVDRPRTAINFVSAKQRAMNRKTANKTMQRGRDLLQMLALDFISFDILDMPPVNEYDLYIRAFGSSNTRQAYVQTNDDNIEREVQTEEADVRQKWTQHPPEDFAGCGRGDGEKDVEEEEESQQKQNKEQDTGRLNKFLEKAGQVIAILLEEQKDEEGSESRRSKSHINISEGYTELDILPILQGRHVIFSHFSPVQPNLLLTVYSSAPEVSTDNPVSKRGIICVWNTNEPNYPQKILACTSQPQCCCFSPMKPSLVFAGMADGSIAMWDLRESSSLHKSTMVNEEAYSLRYPTYDTAAILTEENHHSPVASIVPIYSYEDSVTKSTTNTSHSQASEDSSSGLSFQLVSTEEDAVMHFWVVAEIGTPDPAGSPNDLGLAPGAQVKLLKSSSITLDNPSKEVQMRSGLRARDTCLLPYDLNQYYVSTDSGSILHGVRFGKRAFPRAHTPQIETIVDVMSLDFSPFEQPCFLAGCSDGTFSLYHTKSEHPLMSWPTVTNGRAVKCVRWSTSRPCVFYILDGASTLYIFDLLEGDVLPKHEETISKEKVISFSLTGDPKASGRGTPGKHPQLLFSLEGGRTEIHTVAQSLREPVELETDYLGSYLQRF